jgi:two-component system, OmpR family, response regulator
MSDSMRILVVEDERRMAELLRKGLTEERHSVTVARDGQEALEIAAGATFDVIILDLILPGIDGFAVARRLRAGKNPTPILILTARDSTRDIVEGLNAGADDYLTKPFSFDELFARVRAVSRRGPIPRPVDLAVGDLTLSPATHEVRHCGRAISLTWTEFALLELLMRHAGQIVPREILYEGIWGVGAEVESNTLDAFIRLLRSKIDASGEAGLIRTVRGIGYMLQRE